MPEFTDAHGIAIVYDVHPAQTETRAVVQLLHAEDAPLGEAQAAPLIERFLAGRARLELAAAEVRRLREAASIEYVGDIQARAR